MIRVCIPFYSEFETCKPGLRELNKFKGKFEICLRQGTQIADSRNSFINDNKSNKIKQDPLNYEWFLFIDSDIGFNKSDVDRLLEHKKEIVSLPYKTHKNPGVYQCGYFTNIQGNIRERISIEEKGLKEVDFCGAGMLLVNRSVFCKIDFPWFKDYTLIVGDQANHVSEDLAFCVSAKRAGYKIYCDLDYPVYHKLRSQETIDFSF